MTNLNVNLCKMFYKKKKKKVKCLPGKRTHFYILSFTLSYTAYIFPSVSYEVEQIDELQLYYYHMYTYMKVYFLLGHYQRVELSVKYVYRESCLYIDNYIINNEEKILLCTNDSINNISQMYMAVYVYMYIHYACTMIFQEICFFKSIIFLH